MSVPRPSAALFLGSPSHEPPRIPGSRCRARLESGDRFGAESEQRQERSTGGDHSRSAGAVNADSDVRIWRGDTCGRADSVRVITAGGQAGRLSSGVDTADLRRRRKQGTEAQHNRRDDHSEPDRGLDRHSTTVADDDRYTATLFRTGTGRYTVVLSARSMIFVNAFTMLSPVTTP